jgi:hypothetical protein
MILFADALPRGGGESKLCFSVKRANRLRLRNKNELFSNGFLVCLEAISMTLPLTKTFLLLSSLPPLASLLLLEPPSTCGKLDTTLIRFCVVRQLRQ